MELDAELGEVREIAGGTIVISSEEVVAIGCSVCRRPCRRPSLGASWVLEWRLGEGPVFEMNVGRDDWECEAFVRNPSSPLPGSYRQLMEVSATGRRVAWLRVDACSIALQRRQFLALLVDGLARYLAAEDEERTRGIADKSVADLAELDRARARCLRDVGVLVELERRCARQPDMVVAGWERLARAAERLPARSAVRTRAPSYEAWDFVRHPVGPWGKLAAELAESYLDLAGEVEREAHAVARAWQQIRPGVARVYECVRDDLAAMSVVGRRSGFGRIVTTRRKVRDPRCRKTREAYALHAARWPPLDAAPALRARASRESCWPEVTND